MELLGIVLSIPVAFVASMLYCLFLARVLLKFERPSRWLRIVSRIVMALFAAELILLVTLGPVRSRGLFGPAFYVAHVIFFFLGTPALANLLVLRPRPGVLGTWYVAGAICTAFAFFLVLLQYTVSESLFGIDGENGPYSQIVTRPPTCAAVSSKPLP
jgi:hypothetical protein